MLGRLLSKIKFCKFLFLLKTWINQWTGNYTRSRSGVNKQKKKTRGNKKKKSCLKIKKLWMDWFRSGTFKDHLTWPMYKIQWKKNVRNGIFFSFLLKEEKKN